VWWHDLGGAKSRTSAARNDRRGRPAPFHRRCPHQVVLAPRRPRRRPDPPGSRPGSASRKPQPGPGSKLPAHGEVARTGRRPAAKPQDLGVLPTEAWPASPDRATPASRRGVLAAKPVSEANTRHEPGGNGEKGNRCRRQATRRGEPGQVGQQVKAERSRGAAARPVPASGQPTQDHPGPWRPLPPLGLQPPRRASPPRLWQITSRRRTTRGRGRTGPGRLSSG